MAEGEILQYDYYVERIGQGDPLIFLPAGGFLGNEGMNIAHHLKEDYETHMLDLPGMGRGSGLEERVTALDMANWVKDYLDARKINRAVMIGHSLGGAIALSFAAHYPDRVIKLVLLDQGHKPFPRVPLSEFGPFAFAFPLINAMAQAIGKPFTERVAGFFSISKRGLEDKVDAFCGAVSIEKTEYVRLAIRDQVSMSGDSLNLMFGLYNLNQMKLLEQLNVPTYLAYATFEDIDRKEERRTRKHVQKLKKTTFPIAFRSVESGHYVHWSDPLLLGDIQTFLLSKKTLQRM
ncbi:alpha/beta fold hydrolase [Pseudalkalibacillus hwajinpoensis]|uniref:Alpha/beta hydrolase n=1 Tax=Guptibacillus hwajinpoensis TaxID=208199 RepID=A0A4U1MNY3_9BACL|nr:alpha/beta hydrolase [Pseudalkalibacillus hwajinpoensis]TKD72425.1 alpha/beta hydrolase [Pseudalkalibacillus hwajinpoensis]